MKTTLFIIAFLILTVFALLIFLGQKSKSGKAPELINGKLMQCSDKPNCICSEYKTDEKHYIEPIILPQEFNSDILTKLENTVIAMGGKIQNKSTNYISANFTSSLFGFVDDFEIRVDSDKNLAHLCSRSRVGNSDLGANKKRALLFKKLIGKEISDNK